MTKKLTPKQQAFIDAFVRGATATQAAIDAGYSKHSAKTIANNLATRNPLVRAELERIAAQLSDKYEYSAQVAMADLRTDIEQAKGAKQYSAVGKLRELQLRLHGLLRDKLEVTVEARPNINEALETARSRVVLRPMCDPAPAIDGEFVALPHSDGNRPIDSQSTGRRIYGGDEIFE